MKRKMRILLALLLTVSIGIIIPVFAFGADKLIVRDGNGNSTFVVEDSGATRIESSLVTNGASGVGIAPFVLGQDIGKRGIVITDKAATNPKRVYIGWNVGSSHDYAEIFALQEGVAWKNLVFVPHGGNVGIGTTLHAPYRWAVGPIAQLVACGQMHPAGLTRQILNNSQQRRLLML